MNELNEASRTVNEAAQGVGSDASKAKDFKHLKIGGELIIQGPKFQNQSTLLQNLTSGEEFEIIIKRGETEKVDGQLWINIGNTDIILENAACDDDLLGTFNSFYFSFAAAGNENSSVTIMLNADQAYALRDVLSGYLQAVEAQNKLENPIKIER